MARTSPTSVDARVKEILEELDRLPADARKHVFAWLWKKLGLPKEGLPAEHPIWDDLDDDLPYDQG